MLLTIYIPIQVHTCNYQYCYYKAWRVGRKWIDLYCDHVACVWYDTVTVNRYSCLLWNLILPFCTSSISITIITHMLLWMEMELHVHVYMYTCISLSSKKLGRWINKIDKMLSLISPIYLLCFKYALLTRVKKEKKKFNVCDIRWNLKVSSFIFSMQWDMKGSIIEKKWKGLNSNMSYRQRMTYRDRGVREKEASQTSWQRSV